MGLILSWWIVAPRAGMWELSDRDMAYEKSTAGLVLINSILSVLFLLTIFGLTNGLYPPHQKHYPNGPLR